MPHRAGVVLAQQGRYGRPLVLPVVDHRFTRVVACCLTALAAAAASISVWQFWPYTMDDSFISFRYAQNLVQAGSLNYNSEPPRAEGYTSLFWTLLLAIPQLLGADPERAAKLAGIALLALAAWRAAKLARALAPGTAAPAAALLFLAAFAPTGLHAVSGMETGLYTLCLTLFLEQLYGHCGTKDTPRHWWSLAASGLALGLTRPEGNWAAAVGYACAWWWVPSYRRRLLKSVTMLHAVPFAVWFFTRAAYYDAWFPLPFYVKLVEAQGLAGLKPVGEFLRDGLLPLVPALGLGLLVDRTRLLGDTGLRAVSLVVAALVGFFVLPEHLMGIEHRFLFPIFPVLCAVAAAALASFVQRVRPTVATVAVLAIALPLAWWTHDRVRALAVAQAYALGLDRAHRHLAAQLRAAIPPGQAAQRCKLAMGDAGAAPFLSGWRTLDSFGLNEHHIATRHDHSPGYVSAFEPDVWVLLSKSGAVFEPLLPWEAGLYEAATQEGYDFSRRLEFNAWYFLWVGTRADAHCVLP